MESVKEAKKIAADLAEIKKNHSIKPGTPAMEAHLSAGYPDVVSKEHAEELIAEWKKDHSSCPYKLYRDALAYLDALKAKPGDAPPYVHPSLDNPDVTHKSL